ncbi:MAG: SDR family oxidoreductase [Lachnospiraceae bacterium]|nr:SDR family oxidoreductase [Lachnospiraceae bacterium]
MCKVAIVTGIASGIGKYVAEQLAKKNVVVYGADIKNIQLDNVICRQCDVSDEKQVIDFIEEIKEKYGKLDYLINVAGILCYKKRATIDQLLYEEWDKVMKVNAYSVFMMTKYAIPLLRKGTNPAIINISSDQVKKFNRKSAPYAVSKAAIEMLTKIAALELLEDKIRVNAVALSSVDTCFIKDYFGKEKMKQMVKSADEQMPFGIISVQDVWNAIRYILEDGNKMTGQILLIDSGTTF